MTPPPSEPIRPISGDLRIGPAELPDAIQRRLPQHDDEQAERRRRRRAAAPAAGVRAREDVECVVTYDDHGRLHGPAVEDDQAQRHIDASA